MAESKMNLPLPDLSGYDEKGLAALKAALAKEEDARKFCKACKQRLPGTAKDESSADWMRYPDWWKFFDPSYGSKTGSAYPLPHAASIMFGSK